jgi:hypothetical protein
MLNCPSAGLSSHWPRDPSLEETIQEWGFDFAAGSSDALGALKRCFKGKAVPQPIKALQVAARSLNDSFDVEPIAPNEPIPVERWSAGVAACAAPASAALHWTYDIKPMEPEHGIRPEQWARQNLFKYQQLLARVGEALETDDWHLVNARAVLLEGTAGSGKSHLLADVVEHQVHAGRPAILVLGSAFVEGDPWRQVMAQLDLAPDLQVKHFLASIDAAAQAEGVRALICIDAINERHGLDIWPDRLAAFLKTAEPFTHVCVVLSCRSTYVEHVVPDIDERQLTRIEHHGFADRGGEAANVYLAKRGIVRPGSPNLVPEFQNPLFLKTCCDFLDREGKKEIPRGLRGVSAIFGFYNHAVARSVTRRMGLDPNLELVPAALSQFTDLLVARGEGYAAKEDVISVFEKVLPSSGSLNRSLLSQFEAEGIIAIEPVTQDDGSRAPMVRFTFERFSDHTIAARMLQEHLDPAAPEAAFAADMPLGKLVFGQLRYRFAGIIEAIAIQLPEKAGREIVDVGQAVDWTIREAFLDSLLWREQAHFTERTFQLAKSYRGLDEMTDLLISIATEPENRFNARFIHTRLLAKTMPDRDVSWSLYLSDRGEEADPVGTLIDWTIQNGMGPVEEERAELAAITLSWFLTASNREVRDKSTKALGCLLAQRLAVAAKLLRTFSGVDDLYVRERLFAAAYGAALQGKTVEGLGALAATTYELVFKSGKPPLNELLRDHARGIIAYARWRGHLPRSVKLRRTRPPYESPWPIEYVSDELIESYKQDYGGAYLCDDIVSSAVSDGDFARYVIDHTVDKWTPVPLDAPCCLSAYEIARQWILEFAQRATPAQLAAFEAMEAAAEPLSGHFSYQKSPEREALKAAARAFQITLTADEWEEYRVKAKRYVEYLQFDPARSDYPAHFDTRWARRWVAKRAHELGWTQARFGKVDRKSGYERRDHRVERIGKKYQWLAFYELLARMADNLHYVGQSYGKKNPRPYVGARDLGIRNTDPSLLVTQTNYDGWKQWGRTWWVPVEPRLRPVAPLERLTWLQSDNDLLNRATLVDVYDPKTKRQWLCLSGFANWRQYGIDGDNKGMQRDTWYRVRCIVTAKANEARLLKSLSGRTLTDPHALPEFELDSEFFLGEYPWHPDLAKRDGWHNAGGWHRLAAPVRPTTASYRCERGGYDYSVDQTIEIEFPAPWLAAAMNLRLLDGQRPTFVDAGGHVQFFDPSVTEKGYQAALVDREAFLTMLERGRLVPVWVVAGEKGVFGGKRPHEGFGGRIVHTAVYAFENGELVQDSMHVVHEKPSREQLQALLGTTKVSEDAIRYPRPKKPSREQ